MVTADSKSVIRTDEALAETHTQAQEEDRCHTAHRDEDNHGWTHVCVEGHHQGFIQTRVVHDALDGQVAEQPRLEE